MSRSLGAAFRKLGFACALGAFALTAAPSLAQSPPPTPSAPMATGRSVEYESNVKALAGVIGGLHALRTSCADANDQVWRVNMQNLLDREGAPGAPLRVGMINAFNDGYTEQKGQFPKCSPSAQASQKTLGARGARLSRALAQSNY